MERFLGIPNPFAPKDLVRQWTDLKLAPAVVHPFDSESSYSNYELTALIQKTHDPQNLQKIYDNPDLKQEYFKFLERIYNSENSYHLTFALTWMFEKARGNNAGLAMETFFKVFSIMGFENWETALLVEKWSEGMEGKFSQFQAAKKGIGHHLTSIIEIERHKRGGFHELFSEFGIANTARYYGPALKYQLESMRMGKMPYVQAIMATGDWRSSMIGSSTLANLVYDLNPIRIDVPRLSVPFRIIEVGNHDEVLQRKAMLRRQYGKGRVVAYYVYGHADEDSFDLGKEAYTMRHQITMHDVKTLDLFGKKWGEHVEHPIVIFDACSVGKELAKDVSEYLGAKVYAPLVPSRVKRVVVSRTRVPRITDVIYSDENVIYDKGKKTVRPGADY